jgi:hypothetical protein
MLLNRFIGDLRAALTKCLCYPSCRLSLLAPLLAALALLTGCAAHDRDDTEPELIKVESRAFDKLYQHPDRPLPEVRAVAIEAPSVEFSEQWLRTHRGDYTERDLERIRKDYGEALQKALAEAFERGQIQVVGSAGEADVVVRPALLRLNIYAPDLTQRGRRDQYVESAGNATFDLRLADPQSDQVLAHFVDHRETPAIVPGRVEETNRGMNYRLFRRAMDRWSRNLVDHLNQEQ